MKPSRGGGGGGAVEGFDTKRKHKETMETGFIKFLLKPKKGIKYFVEHGIIKMEPESIAKFFIDHKDTLNKTQVFIICIHTHIYIYI